MGRTLRTVPVLGLLGLGALVAPGVASAATFTVTTTADNVNTGALRWAINEAEAQPGADTIEFDIAGPGPHTIALGGDLPTLGGPVTIDGYSETGARQATRTRAAELMIAIDAGGRPARARHRRRPREDPRPRHPLRPGRGHLRRGRRQRRRGQPHRHERGRLPRRCPTATTASRSSATTT